MTTASIVTVSIPAPVTVLLCYYFVKAQALCPPNFFKEGQSLLAQAEIWTFGTGT